MKYIKQAFVFSLLAMMLLPSISSAQTAGDIKAKIASLLAQVQDLQNQLKALTGGAQSWCHTFNTNLGIGASGDEVAALEVALGREGFTGFEHSSNFQAVYNENVASAVTGFQEKYRDEILTPLGLQYGTGYVGKSTRAKLNQLYGCAQTQQLVPPIISPLVPPAVKACPTLAPLAPPNVSLEECRKAAAQLEARYPGCTYAQYCRGGVSVSLTSVTPSSGSYGMQITAKGSRFTTSDENTNWVNFASENGALVGSARATYVNDNTLSFAVPAEVTPFWYHYCPPGAACEPSPPPVPLAGSTYSVSVTNANGTSNRLKFTVTSGITPSLTVLSPNGGEVWPVKSTQTIKWTSSGVALGTKVNVWLLDAPTRLGKVLFQGTSNDGSESWTVEPLTNLIMYKIDDSGNAVTPSGKYVIFVECVYYTSCTVDDSDTPFTITSSV